MPRIERAKQFAPFNALRGLQKALRKKEEEIENASKTNADQTQNSQTYFDQFPDEDMDWTSPLKNRICKKNKIIIKHENEINKKNKKNKKLRKTTKKSIKNEK